MKPQHEIPSVDWLSRQLSEKLSPESRVRVSRRAIAWARENDSASREAILDCARHLAEEIATSSLRPAINATGILLHTGLGRSRLCDDAIRAVASTTFSHALVELDETDGKRGDRQVHVRELLCTLTGAESALVVNNCASAVWLTLAAIVGTHEVLLSRGQMVEIGGSFRMPDVVVASGAKMIEVGCTNKTHLSDYDEALTERTRAVLRCHPSNFQQLGFVAEPTAQELHDFCKSKGIVFIDDVGSGCLVDTSDYGLQKERTLQESLSDGADLVLASGDKLLGGPQAGIILGKKDLIDRLKKHPVARATRIDKLCLSALEATLRVYARNEHNQIPLWKALSTPKEVLKARALSISETVQETLAEVGGGSLPGQAVPSFAAVITGNAEAIAAKLRAHQPAIIGRIEKGHLHLDMIAVEEDEIEDIKEALAVATR